VSGLLCVPTADGGGLCAPPCDSDDVSCPNDFACVLRAAADDGVAPGLCLKREDEGIPAGAVCQRDEECAVGLCARADPVGRSSCRKSGHVGADCPAEHACTDGVCLLATTEQGILCADDVVDQGCTCSNTTLASQSAAAGFARSAGLAFALVCLLNRRQRARGKRRGPKRQSSEYGAARVAWDSV